MNRYEALLDYRRNVAAIYAEVRHSRLDHVATWRRFREKRDRLFRTHPQSPLTEEQKGRFEGLPYYEYDASLRLLLTLDTSVTPEQFEIDLRDDGMLRMQRIGKVHFEVAGRQLSLSVFWLLGYGGGLFLPFRDQTSGEETYGGGRYLLDSIKHVDLGQQDGRLVVDLNYAYNPSCAYNYQWDCPLPPRENWLPVAIQAGELRYPAPINDLVIKEPTCHNRKNNP